MGCATLPTRCRITSVSKARVLFVSGLTPMPSGGHGGQLTAGLSLLHSPLAERLEFVPLSSTMKSVPPPPLSIRMRDAATRLGSFVRSLATVDVALVFVADGLSLLEKGSMCLMARRAGRGVVARFSSGNLATQCEKHPSLRMWLRVVLRNAHVVVSQGPQWTRYFNSFSEAAGKVVEIQNGVALPAPHAVDARAPRIVFLGWMHREKGIFELVEAAATVHARVPGASFELIGGGRDLDALAAEVSRRGLGECVTMTGWLPHDAALARLREASIFALPSYYEGLPNAMLEAMATALPVVATPVGSIKDVIRDGENGLLVPVKDVTSLTNALLRLVEDPLLAQRLGERGRQTIIERHSIDTMWRKYGSAIERAGHSAGREISVPVE